MKNDFAILKFVKFLGDKAYDLVNKLSKFLQTKYGKNIVRMSLYTLILIFILRVLELPFFLLATIGDQLLDVSLSTFSTILKAIWRNALYYTYVIYLIISLYSFTNYLLKKKELIKISAKDKENKIFKEALNKAEALFKTFIYLSIVPIIIMIIIIILFIIYLISLAVNGIYLISLFIFLISLISFAALAISAILSNLKLQKNKSKRTLILTLVSILFFLTSMFSLIIETKDYSYKNQLTNDFKILETETYYNLNANDYDTVRITSDRNLFLIKDENLNDEMIIKINRSETSVAKYETIVIGDELRINIDFELDFKFSHINKLNVFIKKFIEDKTIYDYTKLKYGDIQVIVNPEYINRITIVDKSND